MAKPRTPTKTSQARKKSSARRKPVSRRRPTPSRPPILSATNLTKDYETGGVTTRALDNVSVDVHTGRFLSVMGPSGSGKSTLLHLLGGLDKPTSGEVTLEGSPLAGLSDKEMTLARRGTVGFVFQFFNLVPVLTVSENIALPLVISGAQRESYSDRLAEVIELVGLTPRAEQLPSQISGGEQQRTAIARAIFPSPAVVLADEPTGNLDTRTGAQILRLLKSLQTDHGQTIIIVTHDPRAAAFGDEVIYLEDGRIRSRIDPGRRRTARRRAASRDGGGEARAQAVLSWLQELGA